MCNATPNGVGSPNQKGLDTIPALSIPRSKQASGRSVRCTTGICRRLLKIVAAGQPRPRWLFRRICGHPGQAPGRPHHRVGAIQHALDGSISRLWCWQLPSRTCQLHGLLRRHTINLAQGVAFCSIKAAFAKATLGSAYGMSPTYPRTESAEDRAAADRYHALTTCIF